MLLPAFEITEQILEEQDDKHVRPTAVAPYASCVHIFPWLMAAQLSRIIQRQRMLDYATKMPPAHRHELSGAVQDLSHDSAMAGCH